MDTDTLIDFLNEKMESFSFSRLLAELYEGTEPLKKRLTEKLAFYESLESGGEKNQEQTARKIRYWLKGHSLPGSREELFKICFALGLTLEQSEQLFCVTAESGVHYRNPKELIYAFCIRDKRDYPEARNMAGCFFPKDESLPLSTAEYQHKIRESSGQESWQVPTISIRDEFKHVKNEEELFSLLERYRSFFGFHHNTAYRKFCLMMDYLSDCRQDNEPAGLPEEKKYSIQRTTEEYLRMGVPYEKKNASKSRLLRLIKKHWPSPRSVQEMASRKQDVNRKTLLILYLATEGMGVEIPEDRFVEEHFQRINLMLSDCGMALLNLHNPFDYLVIQCLHLEDEDDFMSRRMERFLCRIFREPDPAAYLRPKRPPKMTTNRKREETL